MFGKQYANHLNVLTKSFSELNEHYRKKVQTNTSFLLMQKIYVSFFGIPEIGFQIRSMHFNKILSTHLLNKKIKTIFDAGCGIGAYVFYLANVYPKAQVIGGEIDKFKLNACKNMALDLKLNNTDFIQMDLVKIRKKELYDLIVNIDVLEHIDDYERVIKNFYIALKHNGYLYIHLPQPNQIRIFNQLKNWHHDDHVREGVTKVNIENFLKKSGFKIIKSQETFGFFGKLAWEINHIMLSENFILTGITFPFLNLIAKMDLIWKNKNGLGIAVLAQKK